MKKLILSLSVVLLLFSCARKTTASKDVIDENTVEDNSSNVNEDLSNYGKILNQEEEELGKLPDYKLIIEGLKFSEDGSRAKNIVNFFASDSLMITADVYTTNRENPFILLCHQAGYSRGEYVNTVKELMLIGFNCVALDQRSGEKVNGIVNETAMQAKEKGLPTNYIDAKEDIRAAIDFTYALNADRPIIVVGSSYSASLVLLLSGKNPNVNKVAVFSPGEYLKGISVMESLGGFQKRVFVTASKEEIPKVKELTKLIVPDYLTIYEPKEPGIHGSRALWFSTPGYVGYWKAFKAFLKE